MVAVCSIHVMISWLLCAVFMWWFHGCRMLNAVVMRHFHGCCVQYSCDDFMVAVGSIHVMISWLLCAMCSIHVIYSWFRCAVFMWCIHGFCAQYSCDVFMVAVCYVQYSCDVFMQHSCDVFMAVVGCMRQALSNRWQYSCDVFVIAAFDVCCPTGDSIHVICSCCWVWPVLTNWWQYSCDMFVIAAFDVCCQTGDGIPVMLSNRWQHSCGVVTVAVCCRQYSCHDCYLWPVLPKTWHTFCTDDCCLWSVFSNGRQYSRSECIHRCCIWRVLSKRWQYSRAVFTVAVYDVCCQRGDSIHVLYTPLLCMTYVVKEVTVFTCCIHRCCVWRVLSKRRQYSCSVLTVAVCDVCFQTGDSIHVRYSRLLSVKCVFKQVTVFMFGTHDCCLWNVFLNRWQYSCSVLTTVVCEMCFQTGDSIHVRYSRLLSVKCVFKQATVFMFGTHDCCLWNVLSNRWQYSHSVLTVAVCDVCCQRVFLIDWWSFV